MTSKAKVPDAWDDGWENQTKGEVQTTEELIESLPKLSKAERRAKQAELNRRLWEEAEAPRHDYYVETRNAVPLQTEYKPAVKVLSRKPAPTVVKDPTTGIEKLNIQDEGEDEDDAKPKQLTLEERQAKALKVREEKQRKYEEARERLFGSSTSASNSNTPSRATPSPSRVSSEKNRSRGRGGSRPTSSSGARSRQLYDPKYSPKPDSSQTQKQQENVGPTSLSKTPEQDSVVRQPRGPDGSGRGGHGFVRTRQLI